MLKFSNHTSLEHYNPGATDLAIAPNLQCRSLQSCQRLELHAVVCKANVKSDRWGRGEDKEEKFMDFTTSNKYRKPNTNREMINQGIELFQVG